MRHIVTIITILLFILAVGCASPAEPAPEPVQPAPAPVPVPEPDVPEMKQVDPAAEDETAEAAPEPASDAEEEPELAPLGNRVTGDEPEPVDEQVSDEAEEEIQLTPEKTMTSGDRNVAVGTTLAWKNYDPSGVHRLAVESGHGWDTERHAISDPLEMGAVWEYTFEEEGTFLVRDLFSGNMRMYVTVE